MELISEVKYLDPLALNRLIMPVKINVKNDDKIESIIFRHLTPIIDIPIVNKEPSH